MKEFGLMLGLFSFLVISLKSSVIGLTHSSFGQSSIVAGVYTGVTVPSPVLIKRQETETKSSFEVTNNWKETIITPINKRNESSFTKASFEQILPALSASFVSQSQLNEFIKSSLSTNVLPESFASRYSSLNVKNGLSSGLENSFAISSTPHNMAAEIILTSSQVNGIIKPSLSRDKGHLSTSQQEDKSLVSCQEAFTKSAFFDPRTLSKELNQRTAQFTSSSSILVQSSSLYSAVVSITETKMFTKGSVALTNGPRTSSLGSTIRKTAELKLLSEATSLSSLRKETYQHSMKTFDTKISSEAIKVKFTGISGISQTTESDKMTLTHEGFTSPFISTLRATEMSATSVKTSAASGPPSMKQRNVSLYLSVMASPVVSNKISTNTMTTSTTPLPQLSVITAKSSKFSSRSKTEFRSSSKENKDSDTQRWSSTLTQTSTSHRTSDVALSQKSDVFSRESVFSVVAEESLPSSELSDFTERSSYLTEGMQTTPFTQSKTSQQTYLLSPSATEVVPGSVKFTQNDGKETSVSSKQFTALEENLSSLPLLQTIITTRSKYRSVSETSKQFPLTATDSSHLSSMSRSIDYRVRSSQFTQTSAVSNELVALSSHTKSHSLMPQIASSTLTYVMSSRSLSVATPPSVSNVSMQSSFTIPNQSSTIHTDKWHRRSSISSQRSAVTSELVASSSSSSSPSPSPSSTSSSSTSPSSSSPSPSPSPSLSSTSSTSSSSTSTSPSSSSSTSPSPSSTSTSPSQSPSSPSPSPSLSSSSSSTSTSSPSPSTSTSTSPSPSSSSLSSSSSPSPPPPTSPSSSSSMKKTSIDKHITVTGIYYEPPLSKSSMRSKVFLSSRQSSTIPPEKHVPSSSWQNYSQTIQDNSSFAKEIFGETVATTTRTRHQTYFRSSNSSVVPTNYVTPSSLSVISSSKIPHNINSFSTSLYKKPRASSSTTARQSRLFSSQSSFASVKESTTSLSQAINSLKLHSAHVSSSRHEFLASSQIGHDTYFSSSRRSFVSTEDVTLSSFPDRRSLISHEIRSTITSSHQEPRTSSTVAEHQTPRFSSLNGVVMATKAVVTSSHFLNHPSLAHVTSIHQQYLTSSLSGHEIDNRQSGLPSQSSIELVTHSMSHFETPHMTASVTSQITYGGWFSTSEVEYNVYFSSVNSSVRLKKIVAPSTQISNILFQTQRDTASIITRGFHERLPSTSNIGHQLHFISTESSTSSLVLHTYSHTQRAHSTVLSSTYQPLPFTSKTAHQFHFSTPQSSIAPTVAPSSQPKISSHVLQKRSSTRSTLSSSTPTVSSITTSIVHKENFKASSSDSSGTSPIKEFTSSIKVPQIPAASKQFGTTVTLKDSMSTSLPPNVTGDLSTGQPTTTTAEVSHIKLLVVVATVPSIVLCIFFAAVMFLRRNRRRKNNFKYSIKLEYKDSLRSRCANSRLDLSLKEIYIDLEMPHLSSERKDSIDCSRGTSLTGTQIRELQILSQECKENLEWISEVIARDMETSICPRQSLNRDSVYSIKEKGSYEPSAKIIRRESSKRGRETIKWRVPIVRRRDSGEFDQNDSVCTDDTTLTSEWKDERELDRARSKSVDKAGKIKRTPSHLSEDRRGPLPSKKLDELLETKEKGLEENKPNINFNPNKEEKPQGRRSGKRFETL